MLPVPAPVSRLAIACTAALACALALLLLASAPAQAAGTYEYVSQFSGSGTPAGSFEPSAVAVNGSGDVYVADPANKVVDKFSGSGVYECQITAKTPGSSTECAGEATGSATPKEGFKEPDGLAVNDSGDVYVAEFGHEAVDEFSPTGTYIRQWTKEAIEEVTGEPITSWRPEAMAVNGGGDVYVVDGASGHEAVDEFGPTGTYLRQWDGSGTPQGSFEPRGIAVNPGGDVYVVDQGNHFVDEFSATGTYMTQFNAGGAPEPVGPWAPKEVAVNGSGEVFVSDNENLVVDVFSSTGTYETQITKATVEPEPSAFEPFSLAVNSSGDLYAADRDNNVVDEFGPTTPLSKFPVTITKITGEGEVIGTTTIKNCTQALIGKPACTEEREETKKVTLTAVPTKAGWKFKEWLGVTCEVNNTSTTCEFTMPKAEVKPEAIFEETHAQPLTVYITGEGKVKSSPGSIACVGPLDTGTCTESLEGKVTLTGEPDAGYVLAGWIGCKKTGATTCEVEMTAAREVTAVFLLEGTKGTNGAPGTNGESPTITAIGPGAHCAAGGFEITFKGKTEYLCDGVEGKGGKEGKEGSEGAAGAKGANGEKGANGANGAAGAQGPAGPGGKEGPAGKVQVVTCTKKGKRKKCTTKTVSGTVKFTTSSAQATLSRHGVVYAAGTARATKAGMSLRLLPVRKLAPGRYTLTLISGAGSHETIRSESFTLSAAKVRR